MSLARRLACLAMLAVWFGLATVASAQGPAAEKVVARYVRLENPTGFTMYFRQLEVYSGGKNVVLRRPELITGTVPAASDDLDRTYLSCIKTGDRNAESIVNGDNDTSHHSALWTAYDGPRGGTPHLNPWIEIDLGRPMEIDRVALYGARYPAKTYLDRGRRVVSLLNEKREVLWATKWQYYDQAKYPKGIFDFTPTANAADCKELVGEVVPEKSPGWISMIWLLGAEASPLPADADRRRETFAHRNDPEQIQQLATRMFWLLDDRLPEIKAAKQLHQQGQHQAALDAWKRYWFAKMARVNTHTTHFGDRMTYPKAGDDILGGVLPVITPNVDRAMKYEPGVINWIDLPQDGKNLNQALNDARANAGVGVSSFPLLLAYQQNPKPAYAHRWAEIIDDWCLNFWPQAEALERDVEDMFTFSPLTKWTMTMEALSEAAVAQPTLVNDIPAATLARMQLICLEKYSTAWWRQTRETVFNHVSGGLNGWGHVLPYFDEFHPGQRAAKEWQQLFERFMTAATLADGSLTEVGDEGHMESHLVLGMNLGVAEVRKPAWYTPGWRNRANAWFDNIFYYMFRHLSPGGYEHRFAVDYRPGRWVMGANDYYVNHPKVEPTLNRDAEIFTNPEMRRIIATVGHLNHPIPHVGDPAWKEVVEKQQHSQQLVRKFLGEETPGLPKINSDWMPYTGAYYFRGGWKQDDPFLAMMAVGSHGGSQAPQWPYGMYYHYAHHFSLVAAQPTSVDGLPPDHLQGRRHTFEPGTKTMALTNADEKPAQHRWLSSARFDFGEARFRGTYQRFPTFKGDEHNRSIVLDGPHVDGVQSLRQIIQIRDTGLFIVADRLQVADGQPHEISVPLTISLSERQVGATRPFSLEQLRSDASAGLVGSDNPDGPSVTVRHFASQPFEYRRPKEAKLDFKKYTPRLGSKFGIAEQPVALVVKNAQLDLVSLISSRDTGTADPVSSAQTANANGVVGFHAKLQDGREVWYQTAGDAVKALACGPATAQGQALLIVQRDQQISGLVLGAKDLVVNGKPVALAQRDSEFELDGATLAAQQAILLPIDPVAFLPARNTFADSQVVELSSQTPGVQIRYTTDGTPPTVNSPLYTGPLTITKTTELAAVAYRVGPDGKPLPAEPFEINGTKFSAATYGWYTKRQWQQALNVSAKELKPGLVCEKVTAPWWSLYASLHWLPTNEVTAVAREMEALPELSTQTYGLRYKGLLKVPADGVYTFHAPRELVFNDYATSYDLRVYVDGEEWSLTQWWHGHGTWSVPLKQGLHEFQVDFADARTNPWRKSGMWRYYPRPWAVYPGKPSDLKISGPGLEPQRIPADWLFQSP